MDWFRSSFKIFKILTETLIFSVAPSITNINLTTFL